MKFTLQNGQHKAEAIVRESAGGLTITVPGFCVPVHLALDEHGRLVVYVWDEPHLDDASDIITIDRE